MAEYEKERQEINNYIEQHNRMMSLLEQAEEYFALSSKGKLSASEQLRIAICKQAMDNSDIHSPADVERLRERTENLGKKISALKNKLEGYRQKYDVYSDIAKTYTEISQGDYIGKLALEEKQLREKEGKKREKKL